ncbi:MAG: septal ring lytic transglycosylase RlpA family protein [Prevotella sp.]|nr:septal ring lytic transglycosylase RlpA family protein [Prevotella sp.]
MLALLAGQLAALSPQSSTLSAQTQRGKASYYSRRATGARTSNGERLHHDSLTCAHRSYPFGTMLKVTNPANGKWVIVRVNDRGPFVRGRIIDLSWGAAKRLDMIAQGIASVVVEKVNTTEIPLRPTDEYQLPELEVEVNNGGDGLRPIWREMYDEQQEQRRQTGTQSQPVPAKPVEGATTPKQNGTDGEEALDAISNQPNHSNAYLKRQRK